jgi:transposase
VAAKKNPKSEKDLELRNQGVFNFASQAVNDRLFKNSAFFDSNDLVQVKYEMLRKVEKEGVSVSRASLDFGFSRPTFYQAQDDFRNLGMLGLAPSKRGPKTAHKLSDEIIQYIEQKLTLNKTLSSKELVTLINDKFELAVHPRSIDRALQRASKKKDKSK